MSKGLISTIAGVVLVAVGVVAEVFSIGFLTPVAAALITTGAGMILTGVGTMISGSGSVGGGSGGISVATRNPVAPWEICYGRCRVGGTVVHLYEWGQNDKFLDMVIVLAAHPCQAVDEILFNNKRLQIDPTNNRSFSPLEQKVLIDSPSDITRTGPVVTITLHHDIPYLSDGDQLLMEAIHPVNLNLNGTFNVTVIGRPSGTLIFSYISGGAAIVAGDGQITESGDVRTLWPNYGKNVYFEALLGNQAMGTTFAGMTSGTTDAAGATVAPAAQPWTANCSLMNKTVAMIRLHYDKNFFAAGLPTISFGLRGKNDIYDPRTSTTGYTENAALCIADYLAQKDWGFKAVMGLEIPYTPLIAAANICDENVDLASPLTTPRTTEKRYTLNGHFPVTLARGDVLVNMLTACAGRLTDFGGQFIIWPAAWAGVGLTLTNAWMLGNAAGATPVTWRSATTKSSRFNGVKGTFISPANNWQAADFPWYAQDATHGYSNGPSIYQYDQNLANDQGDRRWLNIQLPFTISPSAAQRIAKIELMRRLNMGTGTFRFNLSGYQIATMDVLAVSNTYFGWSGKYFEAIATRFKMDRIDQGGTAVVLLGTEVDVQETDPSVYDWELIEDLSPQGFQHPGVPNTIFTPDPPTNLVITEDKMGNSVLTWTAPQDAYVVDVIGRYQLTGSTGIWISLGRVDVSVTSLVLPALLAGEQYTVELEAINAAGVTSPWAAINYTPLALPEQWAPHYVQAANVDSVFPYEYTFGLAIGPVNQDGSAAVLADGTAQINVVVRGAVPVTETLNCPAPVIVSASAAVVSGGTITGGVTLFLQVVASDSTGALTPASPIFPLVIPAGTGYQVTLTVAWPAYVGLAAYTVYASASVDLITAQLGPGDLTYSAPNYSPTALVLDPEFAGGALIRQSYNPPDSNITNIRVRAQVVYRPGVVDGTITSISGAVIVCTACIDTSGTDNWTGRDFMITGRPNTDVPFLDTPFWCRQVTAFDPATGSFTFGATVAGTRHNRPSRLPGLSWYPASQVQDAFPHVGDRFVICTQGYDNSATPYVISDAGWSNATNTDPNTGAAVPQTGITPHIDQKTVLRVIAGTSRGAQSRILDNDGISHTLEVAIVIGADSKWIICAAGAYPFSVDSPNISNALPTAKVTVQLPVSNFASQTLLVAPVQVNSAGEESEDGDGPMRLIYVAGRGLVLPPPASSGVGY